MRRFLVLFFFMTLFHAPLLAEDKGQIINVNQNYQIVFTDLGSHVLRQGDIVKVFFNGDDFIYLQVLESSTILSKLGPVQADGYKTNFKDLQRLSVGNPVVKVTEASEEKTVHPDNAGVPKNVVDAVPNEVEIQRLKKELNEARAEIKRLEEAGKSAQAGNNEESMHQEKSENLKEVLSQLKTRLGRMDQIINQN
ncbi:MAG: hypothetical protein HY591_01090 [Candidatus Omnitrophica bacterium]|nr:hypothetical protein [Candidatus Omnitrophota bacterium]